MKIRRWILGKLLGTLPGETKRRLGVHLGVPDLRWSLFQLRKFGFAPQHVMDVGAFQGEWAKACVSLFPRADILCVEPQECQQAALRALADGCRNIRLIQTLLGSRELDGVPFRDTGSGSSVLFGAPGNSPTRAMTTIDTLIASGICAPPQFIKLDVQGYELEVLEGWQSGFEMCQVIQCEISLIPIAPGAPLIDEVVSYLAGRGFVMWDVTELIRAPSDGAVWQIDALFCRRESALRTDRRWRLPGRDAVKTVWEELGAEKQSDADPHR